MRATALTWLDYFR